MKREKFYFQTSSDSYNNLNEEKKFKLLVERVESILGKENSEWQKYISKENNQNKNNQEKKAD